MPELPDLEVFSQHLTQKLKGKKLKDVQIPTRRFKTNVGLPELRKAIQGAVIRKIYREGKELYFKFNNKQKIAIHLMLHGRFYWLDKEGEKKNTLLILSFSNGKVLALSDFQFQAKLQLNPASVNVPDALSPKVNLAFWKERLQSRARVKNLLLDQKVIRGIGNAYADEILWAARISPFSIAGKIPDEKIRALEKAVPRMLKKGINEIKKRSRDIIGGELRDFLVIHNAKQSKSPTGAKIRVEKKGRVTYYTNEQQLFT